METSIKIFTYNEQAIEFDISEKNIMVNATEMAKIFDKDVADFTMLKSTKEFIKECLKNQNSGFLNIETEEDLIISKQKSGTWMHRILALEFAMWLSPAFKLWVLRTIEEILFGRAKKINQINEERIRLQKSISEKEMKYYKAFDDFADYLQDKKKLISLAHQITKYTKPEEPEFDF